MDRFSHLDLHPESAAYLKYLKDNSNPNLGTAEAERIQRNKRYEYTTFTDRKFDLDRKELFVPSPDVKGGIPVYVYTPMSQPDDPTFLVYFHGGGAVLGNRLMVDTVCKILAQDGECIVINVEYRLAPEFPAPAQMDDGCEVVRWLALNKVKLGGSPQSKIGVGGDSAGGRISASIAHDVTVDFQVLVYPNVDKARSPLTGSFAKYSDGPILTNERIKWFDDHAVPVGQEGNPRIAAMCRECFDNLPPALIIVAEHDRILDSGLGYAKVLRNAGVEVDCVVYKGAIHGFFPYIRMFPELGGRALKQIAYFIKAIKSKDLNIC